MSLMDTMTCFAYEQDIIDTKADSLEVEPYEWEQKLMCLKWLVYCISYPYPMSSDLKELQTTADQIVTKVFNDNYIKKMLGDWELIWGVGVFQDTESKFADKTMFLAKYNGEVPGVDSTKVDSYVLSIAGTNMKSNYTLLYENIGVINTDNWETRITKYGNIKGCKVARGFDFGFRNLMNKTKSKETDKTIWDKITELVENATSPDSKKIEITIVGHSLGGALAQLMGLYFVENIAEKGWQNICKFKVSTLGNPSPGNAQWNLYCQNVMNGQYSYPRSDIMMRSLNELDPVPFLVTKEGINRVKEMYKDPAVSKSHISKGKVFNLMIKKMSRVLVKKEYQDLIVGKVFPSEFNENYTVQYITNNVNAQEENDKDRILDRNLLQKMTEEMTEDVVELIGYILDYMVKIMKWSDIKENLSLLTRISARVPFELFKKKFQLIFGFYTKSKFRNNMQHFLKVRMKRFFQFYACKENRNFHFKQMMNEFFKKLFSGFSMIDKAEWMEEIYKKMIHSVNLPTFSLTQAGEILSLLNFNYQFIYQHTIKYVQIYKIEDFFIKYMEIAKEEQDLREATKKPGLLP